jgi:hypothetical protein
MKVFYSDQFVLRCRGAPIPMKKYSMLRERVEEAVLRPVSSGPQPVHDEEILAPTTRTTQKFFR